MFLNKLHCSTAVHKNTNIWEVVGVQRYHERINRLILLCFTVYYIGFLSMRSYVGACYFGLDETNRCHGNECDVPCNMLFFSLLHNSWYLQE